MKNIHILPTDKPSRLIIYSTLLNEFRLLDEPIEDWKHKKNIYITNDEEIKDVRPHKGKWHLEKGNILNKFPDYLTDLSECKLVIMTTDTQLIADGVQAIDDEFLEWFVNNQSCEEVEVKKVFDEDWSEISGAFEISYYKIIIPKEEPKQESVVKGKCFKCGNNQFNMRRPFCTDDFCNKDFYETPKQERSYSEEEAGELVYNIIGEYGKHYGIMIDGAKLNELFEQFKKK